MTGFVGGKGAKKIITRDVMYESELLKVDIADELNDSEDDESMHQRVEKIAALKERMRTGTFGQMVERAKND